MEEAVLVDERKPFKENKLVRLLAIIRKAMQEAKENKRQDMKQE